MINRDIRYLSKNNRECIFHKGYFRYFSIFFFFFSLSLWIARLWKQCLNFHIRWCFIKKKKKKKEGILFSIYVLNKNVFQTFQISNVRVDVFFFFISFRIILYLSLDSLFVSKFFSKNITGSEYQSVSLLHTGSPWTSHVNFNVR